MNLPPGLIVLVIVVGISLLITVASNWLRNQQRQLEVAAAEKRARTRTSSGGGSPTGKAGAGDIDRFLEEINKLRQKPTVGTEPSSRPPRKAEPVRSAKPPVAAPVARRVEQTLANPLPRLEDLPVAPVVARPVSPPPPPAGATRPAVMKPAQAAAPPTLFARRLTGLLTDPKMLPMAVVLQEVLGPPKCVAGGRPPVTGSSSAPS